MPSYATQINDPWTSVDMVLPVKMKILKFLGIQSKRWISVATYCSKVKLNFLCGFMATLYDAPVFWIL